MTSRVGGIPEQISDGVNGFLAIPNDPEELADRIITMLQKRAQWPEYGIRNISKVRNEFTISDMVRKINSHMI